MDEIDEYIRDLIEELELFPKKAKYKIMVALLEFIQKHGAK